MREGFQGASELGRSVGLRNYRFVASDALENSKIRFGVDC